MLPIKKKIYSLFFCNKIRNSDAPYIILDFWEYCNSILTLNERFRTISLDLFRTDCGILVTDSDNWMAVNSHSTNMKDKHYAYKQCK